VKLFNKSFYVQSANVTKLYFRVIHMSLMSVCLLSHACHWHLVHWKIPYLSIYWVTQ